LPLRMAGANGASYLTTMFEARKNRPNPGMRYREDRRYPLTSRMRKARGSLARPCWRTRLIQGSSGDRGGGLKGI
jgi:hypothetical protein